MKSVKFLILTTAFVAGGALAAVAQSSSGTQSGSSGLGSQNMSAQTHCIDANGQVQLKSAMSDHANMPTGNSGSSGTTGSAGGMGPSNSSSSSGLGTGANSSASSSSTLGSAGSGNTSAMNNANTGSTSTSPSSSAAGSGTGMSGSGGQQQASNLPKC